SGRAFEAPQLADASAKRALTAKVLLDDRGASRVVGACSMQFVILATLLLLMMPNLALGQRNILLERQSDAGCSTLIREVASGTMKFFLMHLARPDCEESP